jgi:hypothetical protein
MIMAAGKVEEEEDDSHAREEDEAVLGNAFLQLGMGLTAPLPACAWGVRRPLAELRCQMALR